MKTKDFFGNQRDVAVKSTIIPANTNLNSLTTDGMYYCPANVTVATLANCPTSNAFSLLVESHAGVKQTLTVYPTSDISTWIRNQYNGAWGPWRKMWGATGVATKAADADTVGGKSASSFATSSHTHDYAPASHTHAYAPVSHTHDYAPASHTHNYAPTSHNHSGANITSGTVPVARLGMTFNNAANGRLVLPNGFILQWGRMSIASGSVSATFSFPYAFPTACRSIVGSWQTNTSYNESYTVSFDTISRTGARAFCKRYDSVVDFVRYVYWQAIGY